jgi:hypothetical protein
MKSVPSKKRLKLLLRTRRQHDDKTALSHHPTTSERGIGRTFSGDACKWLHFGDTFQASVIDNNALSNINSIM